MYYENPKGISVHSGFPNPATDASIQEIDLNKLLIANSVSTYFMRVAGDEWQAVGIFAHDIIVIDRALAARTNDLVVWILDDDFAVSPRHALSTGATVWGVVTSVIHQYRSKS